MNTQDLDHVAHLARLGLSAGEKEKLVQELTNVFSYIEQLQTVNTKKTVPTAHIGGLQNVTRPDVARPTSENLRTTLRDQFPDHSGHALRVPAVFVSKTSGLKLT